MTRIKRIGLHILVWVLYTTVAMAVFSLLYKSSNVIGETSFVYLFAAILFYLNFFLLDYTFGRSRYWLHIPCLILVFSVHSVLRYLFFMKIFPALMGYNSSIAEDSPLTLVAIFFWQGFTFLLFSTGYWFARQQLRNQRAKLELQNVALRAQINPHFLVNTLSHFRAVIATTNPDAAEGLRAVMQFMQSSIPITNKFGKIPLDEELDAIESLVFIFRSRFPNAMINYSKNLKDDVTIVPHVLSPFVENAFKHGKLVDTDCEIDISIDVSVNNLYFSVSNQKSNKIRSDSQGIGLKYVRQQLESAYKGRYKLRIEQSDRDYSIALIIKDIQGA